MASALHFATYNSNGHGPGRIEYISKLMMMYDFLLVQEHWLLDNQIDGYFSQIDNICVHGVSGMDSKNLISGRPYGGCAIVWKRNLVSQVSPISCASSRLCAVTMDIKGLKVLICNVYMPCDTNYHCSNTVIYEETLSEIKRLSVETGIDTLIIGGDFNTDLLRDSSLHTRLLKEYNARENLRTVISEKQQIDYTYESKASGARSVIDHFIVSQNILDLIDYVDVVHDGDNLSDHSVLNIKLSLAVEYFVDSPCGMFTSVKWDKANIEDLNVYKSNLDRNLANIVIPWDAVHCNDFFCCKHSSDIQKFHDDLISICIQSSSNCIPSTKYRNRTSVPGWNDYVKEHRDNAIFWHNIWKQNGSPKVGTVADIRKLTRKKYHQAIKQVKQNKEKVMSTKLAEALIDNQSRDYWAEVKKIRAKANIVPCSVDGITGKTNIGKVFANKYEQLYNSVSFDDSHMKLLLDDISKNIHETCNCGKCYHSHGVSVVEIKKALSYINHGKSDGTAGLYTDHLINAPIRFHVFLSLLFKSMLTHGSPAEGFMLSTIIPIPKNKRKSMNDSNNYRGIALSSILGKLFDWVLYLSNSVIFESSNYQYGFKPGHSTVQCSFVVNETIQYYINNGSNVYSMLLDASRAFDRVHYIKLFKLLMSKGICPVIARFLCIMYSNQIIKVKWSDHISDGFTASNGVKQGGVLSPILFGIYIDVLFKRLAESGYGCHIGHFFMGAFGYADDVILLSPTKSALYKLLEIADSFSKEFDVLFNPDKSKLVVFGNDDVCDDFIYFNKCKINVSHNAVHLGNLVGPKSTTENIRRVVYDFYGRVNLTLSQFNSCNSFVKYRLFKTFCMCLYGCQLWDFDNKDVELFYVAWRKCVRRVWNIPSRTHCDFLHELCNDLPIDSQLHIRFIKFLHKALNSNNVCTWLCGKLVVNGSKSPSCNSLNKICCKYMLNKSTFDMQDLCCMINKVKDKNMVSEQLKQRVAAISDAIHLRDNSKYTIDGFNTEELNDIINYLCTD